MEKIYLVREVFVRDRSGRGNILRGSVRQATVWLEKCPSGKCPSRSVSSGKCPLGVFLSRKCPSGMCTLGKCSSGNCPDTVKPGDASGFRKFYSFVLKCETFSKSTAWNALETPETLFILVLKLPDSLRDRWNRKVQMVRRNLGREPCLSDFASFVHKETTLVNDPIFSKNAVLEYVQTPKKKHDKKKKYGIFATKVGEVVKCSVCEGNHDLDEGSTCLQFHLRERSKWLFYNKLCYGSLGAISVNHNTRNCKSRKECKVCKKRHPTCMVIKQRKVRLSSQMLTLQKNQK